MKKKSKPSDYDLHKSLNDLSSQLQKEGFGLAPEELQELKNAAARELSSHKSFKELKDNSERVVNYLAEYFDTFILLGYDSKGERIQLQFCDSALKEDALMKFLEQVFIKYHRQRNESDT